MQRKDKVLVLCVDRDDDLGQKAKVKGPVVGREEILKAAGKLALADPQDSDSNSMFQAVKVFDEMDKQYLAKPAVLTGHKNVGMQSDKELSDQLDKVLKKFSADYVVLVTDGAEDENVLPIIQSRVPILCRYRRGNQPCSLPPRHVILTHSSPPMLCGPPTI